MEEVVFKQNLKTMQISLVIGCIDHDFYKCEDLIKTLGKNIEYIYEIICVVSNLSQKEKERIDELNLTNQLKLTFYAYKEHLMPGEARNIGIQKSKGEYICFLDASTKPQDSWLEESILLLNENVNTEMILGRTKYIGSSDFEECFIAASYGKKALFTVPGTIISKSLINKIGTFLPSIRSGEDSEWIERASYFQNNIKTRKMPSLNYDNLKGKSFIDLCQKWFSNYSISTGEGSVYQRQRYAYIIAIFVFFSALALSWNDKIAGWNVQSFWYIPHISKTTIILLFLIYIFLRTIYIPKLKGVSIFEFSIFNIIRVFFISLILDIVKSLAFIKASSRIGRINSRNKLRK